jgi:hypothetical protein
VEGKSPPPLAPKILLANMQLHGRILNAELLNSDVKLAVVTTHSLHLQYGVLLA